MVDLPCPGQWDYEQLPKRVQTLAGRTEALLKELVAGAFPQPESAADTRAVHKRMFDGLTPPRFAYYAGNYRGTPGLRCLDVYEVEVEADPMVGTVAEEVAAEMATLATEIRDGMTKADAVNADTTRDEGERILEIVTIACDAFVRFLTIHPYANGNGHAGRFLIWSFLVRYRLFPTAWTIEPRPDHKHYSNGIYLYRRGSKDRLLQAVLSALT